MDAGALFMKRPPLLLPGQRRPGDPVIDLVELRKRPDVAFLPAQNEPHPSVAEEVRGLGDRIHYIAKAFSLDKLASKVAKKITKSGDCGCARRRKKLNNLFPAKPKG